jgi:AAA family ATP:ADP antiporter
MRLYISIYGYAPDADSKTKKKRSMAEGIVEGLVLFYRFNYVKGIFAISCLFMVAVTIVDYTLKVLAQEFFAEEYPCEPGMSCWNGSGLEHHGMSAPATAAFTSFMGTFGQATNTLSFLLSLFGTSAVIRYLGLRLTLLLFPSLVLLVIFIVRLYPTLYVVFAAMMTLKANSYALNNPTKEILYQPTSPSVKYKAKSWIDIFGARGSKALGSVVTNAFSDSTSHLVANGTLVGMCVAGFLIWNATFMGRKFDEYTKTGYVVGGDEDEDAAEQRNVEVASRQNKVDDTSCALDDHEEEDEEKDDELGVQEEGQDESEHSAGESSPPAKVTMV